MARFRTLWSLIEQRARHSPSCTFLRDEEGRTLTFEEYRDLAQRVAMGLYEKGVSSGSTVAWQLPTWQEALVLSGALARLGARQVPMLPILREASVSFICHQVEADMLVVPRLWKEFDHAAMAHSIRAELPAMQVLAIDKGELPQGDATLPPPPAEVAQEEPVRWIFYTSGTTADPKGALHTDSAIVATAFGMVAVLELASDDVVPMVFPVTHIGGFVWLVSHLLVGCASLLVEAFSPDVVPYMRNHGVTVAGAGTPFAQTYLKVQRQNPDIAIMPQLRCVTGGGSPKPPQIHFDVKQELGCAGFVSGYGLTECPIAVMNTVRDPDERLAHTEGRALPGMQIKIMTPDGRQASAGEPGVIWLRGPHQCRGYVDPSLNATAFDAEGFLDTGDVGYLEAGGWLVVTGRVKDIIIRKGENISAKKVEDALYQHPEIADVAVVGLPDAERGELVCAVVELSDPESNLTLEDISAFSQQHGLLKQEAPERLEYVAHLPRNPSGKVLKEQLRRQFSTASQT